MPSLRRIPWLTVTITSLRHWMPLDGIRCWAWTATTEDATASAAAARSFDRFCSGDAMGSPSKLIFTESLCCSVQDKHETRIQSAHQPSSQFLPGKSASYLNWTMVGCSDSLSNLGGDPRSILLGQKQRGCGPVCLGDDPQSLPGIGLVAAQQSKAMSQAVLILRDIGWIEFSLVPDYMTGQEAGGRLLRSLQCS